jgi:hypothetical protein
MRSFGFSVIVASAIVFTQAAPPPLQAQPRRGGAGGGECSYFADANYQGMRGTLGEGENAWVGHPWNDLISSIQCDPGCTLELFEDINFGGARERFRGNVAFVGPYWNDRASSLRVRCGGRDWARDDVRPGHGAGFADGFYRRNNDPTVFWLRGGQACRVTNPAQMQRFGGFAQVRLVGPQADLLAGRRDMGPCIG